MAESLAFNTDCMDAMKRFPDKYFDLAVVDPPYGDGCSHPVQVERERELEPLRRSFRQVQIDHLHSSCRQREKERLSGLGERGRQSIQKIISWDVAPGQDYFEELFRISRNQIIWGGNYFSLPPTRCFLIWRKLTISENFTMAMAEYAWTSFNSNAKVFEYQPQDSTRFHPTQKPIALYAWIFKNYAKQGDKILDTHLGSGSSRIAAFDANLDFWGYEIDKTYFDLQEKRFQEHTSQQNLFLMGDEYYSNL